MIGFGAFTLGVGLAAEPSRQSSERMSRENHPTGVRSAGPVRGSREQMEPNFAKSSPAGPIKAQSKRTPLHELAQPRLKKAASAANGGGMMNKMENHHEPLAKLPGIGGTKALGPGLNRSRSAAPAVLGGLTTSGKNSTAALNGTAMKRKP